MCISCNVQTCPGGCGSSGGFTITGGINGFQVNPAAPAPGPLPYQATLGYAQQGLTGWPVSNTPVDYGLTDFLEIIANKSDADACVGFIEKQLKAYARQLEFIELLKKQNQEALDKAEGDFLTLCQKYRPSITSEMIDRIKKLKAFY